MDRRQLLERLAKAWAAFKESYSSLSDAQLTEPGVTGLWSVKDILAHVTTWEEEALIQSAPEDQFARETRFRHRLRLDTYSHYPKHSQAIRRWRERRSAG